MAVFAFLEAPMACSACAKRREKILAAKSVIVNKAKLLATIVRKPKG